MAMRRRTLAKLTAIADMNSRQRIHTFTQAFSQGVGIVNAERAHEFGHEKSAYSHNWQG